jgi:hypothetical protein
MPKLAVRLALSVATAVMVMAGLQALLIRHPGAARATPVVEPAATAATEVPILNPSAGAEPPARPPGRRGLLAMATIRGRVLSSNGGVPDDVELHVEDATRDYQPRTDDMGAFEIHLPAGNYTVEASAGEEVALAQVDDLVADETRTVVLRLGPGVSIAGRVGGCDGPCAGVDIQATIAGSDREVGTTDSERDGAFTIDGLVPGRLYDLVFEMRGKRPLLVRGVPAPRQGLVATLEDAATLNGGFGVGPGEKCPMESATLVSEGEDDSIDTVPFDRQCRFTFTALPGKESVHLTAEGAGWHFELDVPLPAHGDPPFLCLRPPCRDLPPEPTAQLVVDMPAALQHSVYVSILYPNERTAGSGCAGSEGPCQLDDLDVSPNVTVTVRGDGCEQRSFKVDLHAGPNHVGYVCAAVRSIQGILRGTLPKTEIPLLVRCSGEHPVRPAAGRLFHLNCPTRLNAIEYQLPSEDTWRTAAVSDDGDGEGFVEIASG